MSPTTVARSTVSSRGGWSGTTRTDVRIESTSRSRRSICSSVPACHAARVWRRLGSRDVAVRERRLLREQVRVGAHDRERRPQLVGHERDELRPGPVERDELLDLRLGLGLEPALLEDAREQVRDRGQLRDVARR